MIKWSVDEHYIDGPALRIECTCGDVFWVYTWGELDNTPCPTCKRKFRLVSIEE